MKALALRDKGAVVLSGDDELQGPTTLLQAITKAATNPKVDMDKVERLFKMHQEMVAKQAEALWNSAMARAQARIVPVATNADNTQTKSRYAKLGAVNKAIVPIYTEEGLSVSFDSGEVANGIRTVAKVSHKAGHSKEFHLDLPVDDKGPQGTVNKTGVHAAASTNAYARRYLLCMIFNVATEDDDGNKGGKCLADETRNNFEEAIGILETDEQVQKLVAQIAGVCEKAGAVRDYRELRELISKKVKSFKEAA